MDPLNAKQSTPTPAPCVIELREMLQSILGDNFVRLYHYGSRVTGGAARDSDYDVLCEIRRPLNRREKDEVLDRRIDLLLARDAFFDLQFFTSDEIGAPPIECALFLEQVVAEGIVA
jgi:hypothetical protein